MIFLPSEDKSFETFIDNGTFLLKKPLHIHFYYIFITILFSIIILISICDCFAVTIINTVVIISFAPVSALLVLSLFHDNTSFPIECFQNVFQS